MIGRKLKAEDFHNDLISDKLDVLDHYIAWRQSRDTVSTGPSVDGPFSFCSYPFLLNCKAKSKLLHTEAKIRMETTVAQARLEHTRRSHRERNTTDDERVLPLTKTRSAMEAGQASVPVLQGTSSRRSRIQQNSGKASGGVVRGFIGMLLGGSHGDLHEPSSSNRECIHIYNTAFSPINHISFPLPFYASLLLLFFCFETTHASPSVLSNM
jgi:hypothetical protein